MSRLLFPLFCLLFLASGCGLISAVTEDPWFRGRVSEAVNDAVVGETLHTEDWTQIIVYAGIALVTALFGGGAYKYGKKKGPRTSA